MPAGRPKVEQAVAAVGGRLGHHPAPLWKAQNVRRHRVAAATGLEKLREPQAMGD
ncbi:MAG: hypothetical protein QM323_08105 [Acidobacteriota bacterium]|nr:hypothetical protein [Acidobacteriota bacterium]